MARLMLEKITRGGVARTRKDVSWGALLDDHALPKHADAIRKVAREVHVVGRDQEAAALLRQSAERLAE